MKNYIVSIKIPTQTASKKISISVENPSDIFKIIKNQYFDAKIMSFIQK